MISLDPQVKAFYGHRLDTVPAVFPSVAQMRADADAVFNDKDKRVEVLSAQDRSIFGPGGALPLRIYTPLSAQNKKDCLCTLQSSPLPIMLYFHGGGFVIHNIASHDSLCRRLCADCGCLVISVGYRLAPEHKYPAAIQDGYFALEWVHQNAASLGGDPEKIILAGDSAGASISSAVSLLCRDRKGPTISLQILCYGPAGCLCEEDSHSMRLFGHGGYVLPCAMIHRFDDLYLPTQRPPDNDFYLYPGQARDLSGLPRTLSITAECDPLRDDGEAFAQRLLQCGNEVVQYRAPGMMHGFLLYWHLFQQSTQTIGCIAQEVRRLHCIAWDETK